MHQLFFWSEMKRHLAALDFYVFALANQEASDCFRRHVLPSAVFDIEELARRRAWSVLRRIRPCQLESSSVRQVELVAVLFCGAFRVLTTAADWAARKGHVELLRWLLEVAYDSCTQYAMNWAARNGHMDVLVFLKERGDAECTNAAADWAAARGHDRVLEWLYENTRARCSELGPIQAAGMGYKRVLTFIHRNDPTLFRDSTANFALNNGHDKLFSWLKSIGCHPTEGEEERHAAEMTAGGTRKLYTTLYVRWD